MAFVVPPGVTWPLPIYELALMTERRARERGPATWRSRSSPPRRRRWRLRYRGQRGPLRDAGRARDRGRAPARGREERRGRDSSDPGDERSTPAEVSRAGMRARRSPACRRTSTASSRSTTTPGSTARGHLRGGRRHELPDQAGGPRHPAGRRGRRAHRRTAGADLDPSPSTGPARQAADREESLSLSTTRGRRRGGRGLERLPLVAAAQDQRPLPAPWLATGLARRAGAPERADRRRGGAAEGMARRADGARPVRAPEGRLS